MAHRPRRVLLPAVLLAFAAGCASNGIEVSTTYDPLTRFPAEATWSWETAANSLPKDERITALDLAPRLEAAVEAEFGEKGYRLATSGQPDFLLSYQVAVHSWIGADNSRSVASLSLLLKQAATGRRVWLGFGRAELHLDQPQDQREKRLRVAVAKILAGFPPRSGR